MSERKAWMDRPHEFREDTDDYSMCLCGTPGDEHWRVEGIAGRTSSPTRKTSQHPSISR